MPVTLLKPLLLDDIIVMPPSTSTASRTTVLKKEPAVGSCHVAGSSLCFAIQGIRTFILSEFSMSQCCNHAWHMLSLGEVFWHGVYYTTFLLFKWHELSRIH